MTAQISASEWEASAHDLGLKAAEALDDPTRGPVVAQVYATLALAAATVRAAS